MKSVHQNSEEVPRIHVHEWDPIQEAMSAGPTTAESSEELTKDEGWWSTLELSEAMKCSGTLVRIKLRAAHRAGVLLVKQRFAVSIDGKRCQCPVYKLKSTPGSPENGSE